MMKSYYNQSTYYGMLALVTILAVTTIYSSDLNILQDGGHTYCTYVSPLFITLSLFSLYMENSNGGAPYDQGHLGHNVLPVRLPNKRLTARQNHL